MKTTSLLSTVTLLASFAIANAAEPVLSPKATSLRSTIAPSAANDVDLVKGRPMLGKATPGYIVAVGSANDTDTTMAGRNCVMTPRTKNDAAACEKHCKTFATK